MLPYAWMSEKLTAVAFGDGNGGLEIRAGM